MQPYTHDVFVITHTLCSTFYSQSLLCWELKTVLKHQMRSI